MVEFEPIADRVIVKADPIAEELDGLIIPDQSKEKPQSGTVLAVGKGKRGYEMTVEVGDRVFFSKYGNAELPTEEGNLFVIRECDLYARQKQDHDQKD